MDNHMEVGSEAHTFCPVISASSLSYARHFGFGKSNLAKVQAKRFATGGWSAPHLKDAGALTNSSA